MSTGTPTMIERVEGSPALRRRQRIGWGIGRCLGRIDVRHADRVPSSGAVVLAANHRAFVDGPLLFGVVRRPVAFLVKTEAFTPLSGSVLRRAGQLELARDRFDPAPVRMCLRILRAGGVVGVFPEGTRGDGSVATARPGVGYFALRTGALVVPVACHGTERLTHRRTFARPVVRVTFGEPIVVIGVGDGQRVTRRAAADTTEEIRVALAELVARTASPEYSTDRRAA